jgi:nucleotide-binding universal stress UspA family protein
VLNIKSILFPTDFSKCAAQAMEHALFLAKYFQAKLHIIHAIVLHEEDPHNPAHHFPNPQELHEKLKTLARERMDSDLLACNESEKEVDITTRELRGFSATDLIIEYACEHDIDLIVMGTHGRRGLGYMFLGSIAQEVVREAPCPVYTIRESERPKPPNGIDAILSPVDFSDHSKAAVSMAREFTKLYNTKLQLLHVIEDTVHPAFYTSTKGNILEFRPDIVGLSKKAMERIFKESRGPDIEAEFRVVTGHVVNEILEFAHCNSIDLIVIATHGLSGLKHLILGSVAEKVIRMAPCPVLTVRAFGKSLA